jgi:hypothetical protein
MNTADRSLAMVDYALRRRFAFVDIPPKFNSQSFKAFMENSSVSPSMIDRIVSRMTELNNHIESDTTNLGPGFCIGHSFFCPTDEVIPNDDWYQRVIVTEIAPLVREYWFDNADHAEKLVEDLLR